MELQKAIQIAKDVRLYSTNDHYLVGSCLVTKSGKSYSGCNIDNMGIQSICAERTAFVKALSEGERDFSYIVVVGGYRDNPILDNCLPCGYCRQFMLQFVSPDFKIYTCYGENNKIDEYGVQDLLPHAFKLKKNDH